MTRLILIVVALAFAVGRFFIPTHQISPAGSYEAFSHLFVGGLAGAWLATRNGLCAALAVALSVVELLAFFALKG